MAAWAAAAVCFSLLIIRSVESVFGPRPWIAPQKPHQGDLQSATESRTTLALKIPASVDEVNRVKKHSASPDLKSISFQCELKLLQSLKISANSRKLNPISVWLCLFCSKISSTILDL